MSQPQASAIQDAPAPATAAAPASQIPHTTTTTPPPTLWSNLKYFSAPSGSSSSLPPPPTSDPVPTASELKTTFLSPNRPPTGPDAPLLTSAARARLYPSAPRKIYTTLRLRLRFADLSQLEATFSTSATLSDVFEMLAHSLEIPAEAEEAILWQRLPKREWTKSDKKVALKELGWVPNAVVEVRWKERQARVKSELRSEAREVPVAKWEEGGEAKGKEEAKKVCL
ncbi:hypothetical protein ACQY0O_003596 [Thecaphora frezii]